MSRLCEPSSELHIAEDFYRRRPSKTCWACPASRSTTTALYRALDRAAAAQGAHRGALQKRLGELFEIEYDLLLYDVTLTYFEGLAEGNPQANAATAAIIVPTASRCASRWS